MQAKVQLQPGYILHRRPYRDSSLMIEAFTRDYGRVGLVAKGAKRGRSSSAALLEPFQPLLISWSGKGELSTLVGVELLKHPRKQEGENLLAAFYVNELMMRLLQRHIPHPELYDCYTDTLHGLSSEDSLEWKLRLFERDLLQQIGYGLLLTHTADTGDEIHSQQLYCFHSERGAILYDGADNTGTMVKGSTLLALSCGEEPDSEGLKQSKLLMRGVLSPYLGDKPLASRELFRQRFNVKSSVTNERQV